MTDVQSSSVILWKITSRRMPALLTDVDAAEVVHRGLDDLTPAVPARHRVGVDRRLAAALLDDLPGLLGWRVGLALAGQRGADVVDDDLGAFAGHHDGDLAADAAAGAGDDRDLAGQHGALGIGVGHWFLLGDALAAG